MTPSLAIGYARRLAIFLVALVLALPFASHAQFGGGMGGLGGGRAGGGHGGHGDGRPPPGDAAPGSYREDPGLAALRGLNELREQLQLKPPQRDAFARYADRVMALAADLQRLPNPARFEGKPAPGQLDALADIARNRLTAVEDVVDAGKALYESLSEEQKALADARLARLTQPLVESDPASRRAADGAGGGGGYASRKGTR